MKKCKECGQKADIGKYCYCCRMRKFRENNRMKAAYFTLRDNSKRRGKIFELTFDQFSEFCRKTDYLNKSGKFKDSFHIDRINENEGYLINNIQVLTNSENVKKYMRFKELQRNGKPTFEVIVMKEPNFSGVPF
jgi:hypothetical protein